MMRYAHFAPNQLEAAVASNPIDNWAKNILTFTAMQLSSPQIEGTKKPPFGGFTTLLIALIILCFPW